MNTELIPLNSRLQMMADAFVAAFSAAETNLREAARIAAEMAEEDPAHWVQVIAERTKLDRQVILNLERVGRGLARPELWLDSGAGARRLIRCAVSEQERFLNEPMEVFNPDAPTEPRLIHYSDLTPEQAQIVIDIHAGAVNSLAKQRSLWEQRQRTPSLDPAMKIVGDAVLLPCRTYTVPDLERILKSLRKHKARKA